MENITKRKDGCMGCDAKTLKKARYSWQVKRSLGNPEDISSVTDVVICDNAASCKHCNSRGDNSNCKCDPIQTSKKNEDQLERDMECTVSNSQEEISVGQESHISNQLQYKGFELCDQIKLNSGNNFNSSTNALSSTLSTTSECFNSVHNFSRTSSPASSSINFSFEGPDVNASENQREDGRASVSTFSNTTSMLALPSNASVDPETEEENLLLTQREEELNLYLKRWQNQHIAKSIVDNAINKTLEEMGVSPEPEQFVSNLIESQGISEAIKLQGLIPQAQCSHMGPVNVLSDLAHSSNYFLPLSDRPKPSGSTDHTNTNNILDNNSELLDHAVSVAIDTQGLTFGGNRS